MGGLVRGEEIHDIPLQALMTRNDQTFVEASQALGGRMWAAADDPEAQVAAGFLLATSRDPEVVELQSLTQLYHDSRQRLEGLVSEVAAQPDHLSRAALGHVASVLLNLDEVLCK